MNRKKIENHNRNGAAPHVGEAAPVFSRKKGKQACACFLTMTNVTT
jgi:hypothetical protein